MTIEETKFYKPLFSTLLRLKNDPFSKVTRQRQKHILVTSALTILLSLSVITTDGGSFLGLKFKVAQGQNVQSGQPVEADPKQVEIFFEFITGYLVLMFWIAARQDTRAEDIQQGLVAAHIDELTQATQAFTDEQANQIKELKDRRRTLWKDRLRYGDDHRATTSKFRTLREPLNDEMTASRSEYFYRSESPVADSDRVKALEAINKVQSVALERQAALLDQMKQLDEKEEKEHLLIDTKREANDKELDTVDKQLRDIEPNFYAADERLRNAAGLLKEYARRRRVRHVAEVWLTMAFGLVAIIWQPVVMKLLNPTQKLIHLLPWHS